MKTDSLWILDRPCEGLSLLYSFAMFPCHFVVFLAFLLVFDIKSGQASICVDSHSDIIIILSHCHFKIALFFYIINDDSLIKSQAVNL